MRMSRGVAAGVPYAAVGTGPPVLVSSGLWPTTGVDSDAMVTGAIAPLKKVAAQRTLVVVNRRPGMPSGLGMRGIAAEYADAVRAEFGGRVDVLGCSTGGSIAQQLAVDHPDVIGRLILVSTACRLGAETKHNQALTGRLLRENRKRDAMAIAAMEFMPPGLGPLGRAAGWVSANHVVPDDAEAADLATTLEAEDAFDLAALSPPISAPTLIVGGDRDKFYPRTLFEETAALIPDSTLLMVPGKGHIGVTSSARAQTAVADFLLAG
ncbi:MAG: alpha/beta hydrolase [Gordonia sp. (in: high G+C Gram-positive bacteria)]|uniref:alpha/beta fold hydrolase n=1 Tax=Gordonia sp. (in: high G+C Gram-positive bacteria) TaxID=84139 RepID=UPI0039E6C2E3